jgi:hypothetical protein
MPTQTYTPIASQTLASNQTTITMSSIPSTYTDLVLVLSGIYTASNYVNIRVNNDNSSNYSFTYLRGNGSSAISGRNSNQSFGFGITESAENAIFNFQNYSNATTNKTVLFRSGKASDDSRANVGLWRSTSAINRVDLHHDSTNGFSTGTVVTLYGIKAGS